MFKKIRLPMLAVVAGLVLAISLSAFASGHSFKFNPTWEYVGPSGQTQMELNDPDNYTQTSVSCGTPGTKVCTIVAPSDGGSPAHPILNQGNVTISNSAYSPVAKL